MTTFRYELRTPAAARRHLRARVLFAGAAAVAALGFATAAAHSPDITAPGAGVRVVANDDDNGNSVNDNGQTPGDIFTQNAQDQSTA
ncbi:hypothetical protein BN971_02788 [Mycobacterium bohemicum DSM 44277]|jgi:hypothetical protein|uniref:Uncharacterized protein n=1 Tax=Mycobacterium bohemicum DSM 44277 TaxID=1236609 RepID=A0A0U0WAG4_MYCBE|nr:hypothetical protein [Mycobacterium bohemicum]MCV6971541.1 hypothetical protein [Mycobacterium bohemicum]CPR11502.1 hypothetical protein BN971_02788 [Mycobacterium bohemicum DSM 44277]